MQDTKQMDYYLEDMNRLSELKVEVLESWVKEYPYAHNLRLLLAKKNQMLTGEIDKESAELGSVFALNREKYFEKMMSIEPEFNATEEKLKIESTEKELDSIVVPTLANNIETNGTSEEILHAKNTQAKIETETTTVVKELKSRKKKKKKRAKKKLKAQKKVEFVKPEIELIQPNFEPKKKKFKKKSKKKKKKLDNTQNKKKDKKLKKWKKKKKYIKVEADVFENWLKSLGKKQKDKAFAKKIKKKLSKNKASKISDIEKSVRTNEAVISESLAELLAKQGHKKKAKKMYKKLGLIFPKKSAYFAAQIKKLK